MKHEPIILPEDKISYDRVAGSWHEVSLDDISANLIRRIETVNDTEDNPGRYIHFNNNITHGPANTGWHRFKIGPDSTIHLYCHSLSVDTFIEIWNRCSSVEQALVSYARNHLFGYNIQSVAQKARNLRKRGVPLKWLEGESSGTAPRPWLQKAIHAVEVLKEKQNEI